MNTNVKFEKIIPKINGIKNKNGELTLVASALMNSAVNLHFLAFVDSL